MPGHGGARPGAGRPRKPRDELSEPYRRRLERDEQRRAAQAARQSRAPFTMRQVLHATIGPAWDDASRGGLGHAGYEELFAAWRAWNARHGLIWRARHGWPSQTDKIDIFFVMTGREEERLAEIKPDLPALLEKYLALPAIRRARPPDPPGWELVTRQTSIRDVA